jgi:hypothetical protein
MRDDVQNTLEVSNRSGEVTRTGHSLFLTEAEMSTFRASVLAVLVAVLLTAATATSVLPTKVRPGKRRRKKKKKRPLTT